MTGREGAGFLPRLSGELQIVELDGLRLRLIGITATDELPDSSLVESASEFIATATEGVERGDGAGFAIVHTGVEAVWLLIGIWHDDIVHLRTFRADSGTVRWTAVEAWGPTMCLWEMDVIESEHHAWIRHVIEQADVDGYLRRGLILSATTSDGGGPR